MLIILNLIVFVILTEFAIAAGPNGVLILINAQNSTNYHRQLGDNLLDDLKRQSEQEFNENFIIKIQLLNEFFNGPGDWTVLYALPKLFNAIISKNNNNKHNKNSNNNNSNNDKFKENLIEENIKWIVICEDTTRINIKQLIGHLHGMDSEKNIFLGYPLHDQESTIIHHFAFFKDPRWYLYPLLRTGIVFSTQFLGRIATVVADYTRQSKSAVATEFNIDAPYELSRFIFNHFDSDGHFSKSRTSFKSQEIKNGFLMKSAPFACSTNAADSPETCALLARPSDHSNCPFHVNREQIHFAIKTYRKFHRKRVPIINATWAQMAVHKRYYSDLEDPRIPTIATGIPNSETGHCRKTFKILELALDEIRSINHKLTLESKSFKDFRRREIEWLLLTDDDTLVSIPRLCDLLGCFSPTENIYLGERYGYRLFAEDGFNYITGGGGILFSIPAIKAVLKNCKCITNAAPDDMVLGACLNGLNIRPTHSPQFHQARPFDYAVELLQLDAPISFHKFWQMDPLDTYATWFAADDQKMLDAEASNQKLALKKELNTNLTTRNRECKFLKSSDLHSTAFTLQQFLASNNDSCLPLS